VNREDAALTSAACKDTELSLLKQKLDLIRRMCRLTEQTDLTEPDGAEKYVSLVDSREKIIAEIKTIELKLQELSTPFCENTGETAHIKTQTEEAIRELLALEKELTQFLPVILADLKNNIRKVKTGQSMGHAYRISTTAAFGAQLDVKQ
jgi:hypothetical protein